MKIVIRESLNPENPLENEGIVCINRNNTKNNEINDKLKNLSKKGYILKPVYCYEHGGRVFSEKQNNKCQFDNYLYGVFAFPKDYVLTEDILKSVYETYTLWAEGEVYDFLIINEEDELKENNMYYYLYEKIDFQDILESENKEIIKFLKENKIKKSSIEDANTDERLSNFRSLYYGKNKFGLIKNEDINEKEWNYEFYGIDSIINELKEKEVA